jgi:hypothetical protein
MNTFNRSMLVTIIGMMAMGEAMAEEATGSVSQPMTAAREIEFLNVTDKMVYLFYQAGPDEGRLNLVPNSPYTHRLCQDCASLDWKIATLRKESNGQQNEAWNRGRIGSGRYAVYYSPERRLFGVMTASQWEQTRRR